MTETVPAAAPARWSMRRQLTTGVIGYLVLLSLGVIANDYIVNESAENLVWETLLKAELDHFEGRRQSDPQFQFANAEPLEMFELKNGGADRPDLRALSSGIHDEIIVDQRERVVLIKDGPQSRLVLALDIQDLESREFSIRLAVFASAGASILLLGFLAAWGANRLTQPLLSLASQIQSLNPESRSKTIALPENSSSEIGVIVDAMNNYSHKLDQYIAREHEFISTASHELRTPIAVIKSAVSLTLDGGSLPQQAEHRLNRVQDTLRDIDELLEMLLALAKNPDRLAETRERISLAAMIENIVHQYTGFAQRKGLSIKVDRLPDAWVSAPYQMLHSAIGNLLRNAIEHSHVGEVLVRVESPASVIIENASQGDDIAALASAYARVVRGNGRDGGGIGLALISRLCQHCGWTLTYKATTDSHVLFKIDLQPQTLHAPDQGTVIGLKQLT